MWDERSLSPFFNLAPSIFLSSLIHFPPHFRSPPPSSPAGTSRPSASRPPVSWAPSPWSATPGGRATGAPWRRRRPATGRRVRRRAAGRAGSWSTTAPGGWRRPLRPWTQRAGRRRQQEGEGEGELEESARRGARGVRKSVTYMFSYQSGGQKVGGDFTERGRGGSKYRPLLLCVPPHTRRQCGGGGVELATGGGGGRGEGVGEASGGSPLTKMKSFVGNGD